MTKAETMQLTTLLFLLIYEVMNGIYISIDLDNSPNTNVFIVI